MTAMAKMPVKLDITIDPMKIQENNCCEEVLSVLKSVRPSWFDNEEAKSLKSKVFTGGISNQLYGYYQDGHFKDDVVLMRIYGSGTELMIDRDLEKQNIQILSAAGKSQPLYAAFDNGLVYGFAQGVTLDENTVRDERIRKLIAEEMIEVHAVRPEGREVKTGLWEKIYKFLELSPEGFNDPERNKQYLAKIKPKDVLRKELDELRVHLEALNSPVVFCHNDLLLKNIIYNEEKGCVYFIDHEYAMYNYEHFELGNHFCEYAGVDDLDFARYPDKEYQMEWLRYYLQQCAKHRKENPDTVSERDVEICYVKANKFALVAHMFWGLWGLVQAKHSAIDFGFLEYAQQKLDEYFARKEEFLALKLPS
ncbi:ethanolamine kinase 1-like [Mercenaria mercenaria]|uniref:ethanolamine kinase 1-like n=1 Tax=Mercenaria mercenaria TaxID=6596 RepID=UPI00234F511C|nr:ethanolamine kinase 1-like [Mercenaria mercenaria]